MEPKEIIFGTKDEAELVLHHMRLVIKNYRLVTVGDLRDMVGLPSTRTDEKWGWYSLPDDVEIHKVEAGYLLNLPPVEAKEGL